MINDPATLPDITSMSLLHRIAFGALKMVARLPFWMLYRMSDIAFLLLYHVVRYRRKVVLQNLKESYPERSPREISAISRRFYRNFTDNIFEAIKLLHITDEEMRQRMIFEDVAVTDRYMAQGRSVVAYFSHCGNWEWAPSFTLWTTLLDKENTRFCQIYRPLRNHAMDKLMLLLRSRFYTQSLAKRTSFLDLMRFRKQNLISYTGFMSDQKPSHGDVMHVVKFLNHPTAMITGTETVARRLDAVVVYWEMSKPSRGHYRIRSVLITDQPNQLPEYAITDRYASLLQQNINADPALWLWTHKRWKHPVTFADNGKKFGI
jgi:KDO2-lipid IV(A) lauroyltransferase